MSFLQPISENIKKSIENKTYLAKCNLKSVIQNPKYNQSYQYNNIKK